MTEFPFPDESFGGVISTHVIHHARRKTIQEIIASITCVLAPDGYFALALPTPDHFEAGHGEEVEPGTWVDPNNKEGPVPHHFCTEGEIRRAPPGLRDPLPRPRRLRRGGQAPLAVEGPRAKGVTPAAPNGLSPQRRKGRGERPDWRGLVCPERHWTNQPTKARTLLGSSRPLRLFDSSTLRLFALAAPPPPVAAGGCCSLRVRALLHQLPHRRRLPLRLVERHGGDALSAGIGVLAGHLGDEEVGASRQVGDLCRADGQVRRTRFLQEGEQIGVQRPRPPEIAGSFR